MTDFDAEEAVEDADTADAEDAEPDTAEEAPAMTDDDTASLPPDLADQAEQEAEDADDDAPDDTADQDAEDTESDDGAEGSAADRSTGDTYGELYAKTLVNVTNSIIDERGKPDAEKTDIEAARQLDIPHHADRVADKMGVGREMPPEKALLLSSGIFVLTNVAAKTDVPNEIVGDLWSDE
jgi:hypothetical protein